ncbi:MAG: SCO family protein [Gemmatimonadales bacterium]
MRPAGVRPGPASLALVVIGLVTAAWWALALWPAGAVVPEWLARTRAACFGAVGGGLPDTGGWILLLGEPVGMLGVLLAVWGPALREDLRRIRADRRWRRIGLAALGLTLAGLTLVARQVAFATGAFAGPTAPDPGVVRRDLGAVPDFVLTDQHGGSVTRDDFRGRPLLLTFAFGHCGTVCPAIIRDLLAARADAGRSDLPLVVVTLDPWRDSPELIASVAERWRLAGEDRVLAGPVEEVNRVLDGLGISRRRDGATGGVDHQATVIGVDAEGRIVWRLDGGWAGVRGLLPALGSPAVQSTAHRP